MSALRLDAAAMVRAALRANLSEAMLKGAYLLACGENGLSAEGQAELFAYLIVELREAQRAKPTTRRRVTRRKASE